MKFTESALVKPIQLSIIKNGKSYWANHFYSVLQCLHSHKNFQYSPIKIHSYPSWTLNDMRGYASLNFLDPLKNFLYNYGFQYFLVSYLNQKSSPDIVVELINRLSYLYNVDFSLSLNEFSFHISGWDSSLSTTLNQCFTEIFPPKLKNIEVDTQSLIDNSDICLILKNPITNVKVGIFAEVEGNHGKKLKLQSYWNRKSDFCVFSFGVIDGKNKMCNVQNYNINGVDRVFFFFEKTNFVVVDFWHTIEHIKSIFLNWHHSNLYTKNEEFDFFINLMKQYWFSPIDDLLYEISKYIDESDLVGQTQNTLSIITDIRA